MSDTPGQLPLQKGGPEKFLRNPTVHRQPWGAPAVRFVTEGIAFYFKIGIVRVAA